MHIVKSFDGEYEWLSNFYEAPTRFVSPSFMDLDLPVFFKTGEAAFQAAKVHAMTGGSEEKAEYFQKVLEAPTPAKAKYAGRSVRIDVDKWDSIKVRCMREVVFQKFLQHSDLKVKLLETGHALLVEGNDWNDTFWGRCNGKGYNILGSLLMEARGYWYWTIKRNNPEMGS